MNSFARRRRLQLDWSGRLLVLRVCRQVVHLISEHEVQILQQLDLLEVELFLIVDKLLEADLHLSIISLLGLLNLINVAFHLGVRVDERRVLVLGRADLRRIVQQFVKVSKSFGLSTL